MRVRHHAQGKFYTIECPEGTRVVRRPEPVDGEREHPARSSATLVRQTLFGDGCYDEGSVSAQRVPRRSGPHGRAGRRPSPDWQGKGRPVQSSRLPTPDTKEGIMTETMRAGATGGVRPQPLLPRLCLLPLQGGGVPGADAVHQGRLREGRPGLPRRRPEAPARPPAAAGAGGHRRGRRRGQGPTGGPPLAGGVHQGRPLRPVPDDRHHQGGTGPGQEAARQAHPAGRQHGVGAGGPARRPRHRGVRDPAEPTSCRSTTIRSSAPTTCPGSRPAW